MKIGILTLRLFKNYGGILQNYALSRFLQKNGYDVETINIGWYQAAGNLSDRGRPQQQG